MLKSELRPLAPRQHLMDPQLAAVAKTALAVGVSATGGFVSRWVWDRYQARKKKKAVELRDRFTGLFHVDIETFEDKIVRTRKHVRVSFKPKI